MRHLLPALLPLLAACASSGGSVEPARLALESGLAPSSTPSATAQPAPTSAPAPTASATPVDPAPAPVGRLPQTTGDTDRGRQRSSRGLQPGQTLLQGYVGAFLVDSIDVEGSDHLDFVEEPDLNDLVLLGGGGQWVLGGDRIDFGLEGGLAFNFSTGGGAVIAGGGGAAVAVDIDLLLIDLYGGLFASTFLGDSIRLYGAVGPMMEFADYEQDGTGFSDSGSGFGLGYYVRAGVEFVLASRTMLGVGARWSDSTIDVSSDIGDVDLSGTQVFVSVTTGL